MSIKSINVKQLKSYAWENSSRLETKRTKILPAPLADNWTISGTQFSIASIGECQRPDSDIYPFKINAFICDIPAKSFIKFTKGHSGYYACNKCIAKGEYIHDRVTYPYSDTCSLRTNEAFKQKVQQSHHTGTSSLELIPNINMVEDFPLDPMHMLYLGIVKKLLVKLWCFGTPRTKLSFDEMSKLSQLLAIQKDCNEV